MAIGAVIAGAARPWDGIGTAHWFRPAALALGAAENLDNFGDLLALIILVAACDRVLDTMGYVIAQDFLLGSAQRRPDRRDLGHDVDAVAVFLDHTPEAPHLALDPTEPFQNGGFRFVLHA
jgi:hypothetical protein